MEMVADVSWFLVDDLERNDIVIISNGRKTGKSLLTLLVLTRYVSRNTDSTVATVRDLSLDSRLLAIQSYLERTKKEPVKFARGRKLLYVNMFDTDTMRKISTSGVDIVVIDEFQHYKFPLLSDMKVAIREYGMKFLVNTMHMDSRLFSICKWTDRHVVTSSSLDLLRVKDKSRKIKRLVDSVTYKT